MNSENESTSNFQCCSNFAKKHWKLLSFVAVIVTGIASTGYWVGKNDTERKYSDQVNELNSKIVQHENTIENLFRENDRLQGSKEIINKKNAEIKKLENELSTEHRQIILDCYKNIDTHIKKLEEKKIRYEFNPYTETLTEKQERVEKEAARMRDKLDARIDMFIEQRKGCKN
jgi:uncharacterized protein HemX